MRSRIYLSKLFINALYWLLCSSVKISTLITISSSLVYYLVMCLRFFKFIRLASEVFSLLKATLILLKCRFKTLFLAL